MHAFETYALAVLTVGERRYYAFYTGLLPAAIHVVYPHCRGQVYHIASREVIVSWLLQLADEIKFFISLSFSCLYLYISFVYINTTVIYLNFCLIYIHRADTVYLT